MKFSRLIGITILLVLVQVAYAAANILPETVHQLIPNGTSAPLDNEASTSQVGSELSSLPASITRYNASRDVPDAKPSNDLNSYGSELCQLPGFKCISIKSGQTWANLFRNEHKREIVMRLNRTNVALRYRKWIIIPEDWRSVSYMALSPLPEHLASTGKKRLLIDLSRQMLCLLYYSNVDFMLNLSI